MFWVMLAGTIGDFCRLPMIIINTALSLSITTNSAWHTFQTQQQQN